MSLFKVATTCFHHSEIQGNDNLVIQAQVLSI